MVFGIINVRLPPGLRVEEARRMRIGLLWVNGKTLPDIVAALGGERPAALAHEDFGDIWRVAPGGATTRARIESR